MTDRWVYGPCDRALRGVCKEWLDVRDSSRRETFANVFTGCVNLLTACKPYYSCSVESAAPRKRNQPPAGESASSAGAHGI